MAESFADPGLLLGRWARSSTCSDDFRDFLRSLGVADERATTEALEQHVLIFTSATKDQLRLVQQHSWRDGLQVEYGMALNGEFQRRPPQVPCIGGTAADDESEWRHFWTSEGFCTEQTISVRGESLLLRVRSSFVTANELRMDYVLCQMPAGEVRKQTSRFFERSPFLTTWKAAACQFFSGTDVEFNLKTCILWMERAKAAGARLVVMPENSNRDRTYFKDGKPSRELCWEHSETLDGSFVHGIRRACRDIGIWASLGVDLRGRQKPTVHIGILLIAPTGKIVGAVKKHVLWDYEYTLFEPGSEPYQVFDTELGRLGVLCCADGIVPEAARVLCLKGAQVLLNSLNSRGPDEMRLHIPLRAIENAVWHVASNTVGNPNTAGLLWPWTGGSEVCDPSGVRVVASEEHDDMVVAEVRPWQSELKETSWVQDLWACRRPELYGLMCEPLESVPAAVMYGPAPVEAEALPFEGPACLKVAMMQLSATHTRQCTEWMTQRQISYAARRGAVLGVLPALWCFRRDEVQKDPAEAAAYSNQILKKLQGWCKDSNFNLCCSLVEEEAGSRFHTAYLVGADGSVLLKYRKTHLNRVEGSWASQGDCIVVESLPGLGRVAVLIADEVWSPELSRCIALQAAEVVLHPADWDRVEAAEMAATERATENRFHLVSVNRLDSPGRIGSQTTLAGEYIGGEPIPLMRYGQGIWCRFGVEELIVVDLLRRQPHCKMMGDHLDVLRKRWPQLCTVCRETQRHLPCWREITDVRAGHFPDEVRHSLQDLCLDKSSTLRCRFADDFGDS